MPFTLTFQIHGIVLIHKLGDGFRLIAPNLRDLDVVADAQGRRLCRHEAILRFGSTKIFLAEHRIELLNLPSTGAPSHQPSFMKLAQMHQIVGSGSSTVDPDLVAGTGAAALLDIRTGDLSAQIAGDEPLSTIFGLANQPAAINRVNEQIPSTALWTLQGLTNPVTLQVTRNGQVEAEHELSEDTVVTLENECNDDRPNVLRDPSGESDVDFLWYYTLLEDSQQLLGSGHLFDLPIPHLTPPAARGPFMLMRLNWYRNGVNCRSCISGL
jgi:hypothetical protein